MSDQMVIPVATAAFLRGYDSAYPVTDPPPWEVCLFYIGGVGLTPHVWTDAEIAAQPAKFGDPTWVCRLDPAKDTSAQGSADASLAVSWMKAHRLPAGTVMTLDTETLVLPQYITAFDAVIVANGYTCKNYGSLSFVTQNPRTSGGRHSADWRDIPQIDPGNAIVATQYADGAQLGKDYDASLYDSGLPLWEIHTSPAPSPAPNPTEEIVNQLPVVREGMGMPPAAPDANVKTVQGLLLARGYSVGPSGIDGRDGADTTAAVFAFQKAHELGQDGVVGTAETWPALLLV